MPSSWAKARPLLAAVFLLAGCAKETTDFTSGTEPWEDSAAAPSEWPAWPATAGSLAVQTGSRLGSGDVPSHYWAHGRLVLASPIASFWEALQGRPGAIIAVYPDTPTVDCEPIVAPEPQYELSLGVREIPNDFGALGRANWFRVDWRGSTTRDAGGAITRVNVRAQKVDGTTYVALMRNSVVATPAPGGGTALEIVRQINAPDESEQSAREWIELWLAAVGSQLGGAPILPLATCWP
ncbi:MAG: hypothetical protein WB493_09235 [Anaeromyxobacteraceae bacterium]